MFHIIPGKYSMATLMQLVFSQIYDALLGSSIRTLNIYNKSTYAKK